MDRFCPTCKEKLDEHKFMNGNGVLYCCPGCPYEEEEIGNMQELKKDIRNLHKQYKEIIRRVRADLDWCEGKREYQYARDGRIKIENCKESTEVSQ